MILLQISPLIPSTPSLSIKTIAYSIFSLRAVKTLDFMSAEV